LLAYTLKAHSMTLCPAFTQLISHMLNELAGEYLIRKYFLQKLNSHGWNSYGMCDGNRQLGVQAAVLVCGGSWDFSIP